MADESSDKGPDYSAGFPDPLFSEKSSRLKIFERIKEILPRFRRLDPAEKTLVGRIHAQLQRDAHQILTQLQALKESIRLELEGHDDSHLWNSFEAVFNPLLRDYEQIEKKILKHPGDIEDKTSALQCYNAWIDKAKLWVALSSRPHDRITIMRAVVEHTMHVSDLIIDRDLKTLKDYISHQVSSLGLDNDGTAQVKTRLDGDLTIHIIGLTTLKHNKPDDLQLEHLQAWKAKVDEVRDVHYNEALHIIDQIIAGEAPEPMKEEAHDHLKDFFYRLAFLEEEIPFLIFDYEHLDPTNENEKQDITERYLYLELTLNQLNQDLRLTPELSKRVIELLDNLHQAHKPFRETG